MSAPAEFYTPDRIIRSAMTDAGLLQEGVDPTSDQYSNNSDRLNDVINVAMARPGCKLWTMLDQPIQLTEGKGAYSLSPTGDVSIPKPQKIESAYFLDANNSKRAMFSMAWEDYIRLGTSVQRGPITQYLVDKQVSQVIVTFYLVPDANAAKGTVHLLIRNQITNFTGIADTMQFPQEWFMYLRWALADDICTGQPQAIMDRCMQKAELYYNILANWDTEDAPTRFEPDERTGVAGGFR